MEKGYLVLSNGAVFEGKRFGASGTSIGELVFHTNVVGYIETLTDPACYGQTVLMTFPLIGNYGMIDADRTGESFVRGFVVREWCDAPSNFRCETDIDTFLKQQGIVALYDVDTRAITKILRQHGSMNAMICSEVPADLSALQQAACTAGAVAATAVQQEETFPAEGEERCRVTMLHFGAAHDMIGRLQQRGCSVTLLPPTATAEDVLASRPDGVLLSDGPGDPAENTAAIAATAKLAGKLPLFGVGLGHQVLALAMGGKTYKLPYGHHGGNLPVKANNGTRTYMTASNTNYAVDAASLPDAAVTYTNLNDGVCEGLAYPAANAFSVQFRIETGEGPGATAFLYDEFIALMQQTKTAKEGADHAAE